MSANDLANALSNLANAQSKLAAYAERLSSSALELGGSGAIGDSFFITGLTVFVLACFVGYYVVWRVTPALHSPLMAVTNAVSSVIIVGALLAAGQQGFSPTVWLGLLAVLLSAVNIFGGFLVTLRMLQMFRKKGK